VTQQFAGALIDLGGGLEGELQRGAALGRQRIPAVRVGAASASVLLPSRYSIHFDDRSRAT
jgi:hypothetical protein